MSESIDTATNEEVQEIHDTLLRLGEITVDFAQVERAPVYPDGKRENDVEHSFHLAISATEIAATYFPQLDIGLVAQFANVHDLPEIYAGDVRTFNLQDKLKSQKEAAEKIAVERLLQELPLHTAQLLERYEKQTEPEARFVRFIDKLLPAIINVQAGEANTFRDDYDVHTVEELRAKRASRVARIQSLFPDFPLLHEVHILLSTIVEQTLFPNNEV